MARTKKLKLTAREVLDALRARHGLDSGSGKWSGVEEAFCGWKTAGGGIDLFCIAAWETAKVPGLDTVGPGGERVKRPLYATISYEVKVSRADYRREVNGTPGPVWTAADQNDYPYSGRAVGETYGRGKPPWPAKAQHALERSNHFIFAVPEGLLTDEEIERRERWDSRSKLWVPPEAGLVEITGSGRVKVRVPAPRMVARELRLPEVSELVRHALSPASVRGAVQERLAIGEELVRARRKYNEVDRELRAVRDENADLQRRVDELSQRIQEPV